MNRIAPDLRIFLAVFVLCLALALLVTWLPAGAAAGAIPVSPLATPTPCTLHSGQIPCVPTPTMTPFVSRGGPVPVTGTPATSSTRSAPPVSGPGYEDDLSYVFLPLVEAR